MASGLLSSMPIRISRAAQQVPHDRHALQDFVGVGAHQHVVAGDPRLAFAAVDDQRRAVLRCAGIELDRAGEHRAAEADQPQVAQPHAQVGRRHRLVIERRVVDPLVAAIGFDGDAQVGQAGDVRHGCRSMALTMPELGRMHGCRDVAVGRADHLAFQHPVAHLDHRLGRVADVLAQRDDQFLRQRRGVNRPARSIPPCARADARRP